MWGVGHDEEPGCRRRRRSGCRTSARPSGRSPRTRRAGAPRLRRAARDRARYRLCRPAPVAARTAADQHQQVAAAPRRAVAVAGAASKGTSAGSTSVSEMKDRSPVINGNFASNSAVSPVLCASSYQINSIQGAGVVLRDRRHPGIARHPRMELAVPDIDAHHVPGALLQQAVGEATGRLADVERKACRGPRCRRRPAPLRASGRHARHSGLPPHRPVRARPSRAPGRRSCRPRARRRPPPHCASAGHRRSAGRPATARRPGRVRRATGRRACAAQRCSSPATPGRHPPCAKRNDPAAKDGIAKAGAPRLQTNTCSATRNHARARRRMPLAQ